MNLVSEQQQWNSSSRFRFAFLATRCDEIATIRGDNFHSTIFVNSKNLNNLYLSKFCDVSVDSVSALPGVIYSEIGKCAQFYENTSRFSLYYFLMIMSASIAWQMTSCSVGEELYNFNMLMIIHLCIYPLFLINLFMKYVYNSEKNQFNIVGKLK